MPLPMAKEKKLSKKSLGTSTKATSWDNIRATTSSARRSTSR